MRFRIRIQTMSRRRHSKPLIPGLRWLLLLMLLLAATLGVFGVLSHWTAFERAAPETSNP